MKKNSGVSLVEFMIAGCLMLLLLAGMLHFYLRQQQLYNYQESLARIQENGRAAMYLLQQALRSTDYVGCSKLANIHLVRFSPDTSFAGYINGQTSSPLKMPEQIKAQLIAQTDSVQMSQQKILIADLTKKLPKGTTHVTLPIAITLSAAASYIISDCAQAESYQLRQGGSHNNFVLSPAVLNEFSAHAQLGVFEPQIFFIGKTARLNSQGQVIPALHRYYSHTPNTPHEMLEGVEDLKIYYGLANLKKSLIYLTADKLAAKDWAAVKSLRIHLLLSSVEPVLEKPQSYVFNGKNIMPVDRLMRREWITTVALRERLF